MAPLVCRRRRRSETVDSAMLSVAARDAPDARAFAVRARSSARSVLSRSRTCDMGLLGHGDDEGSARNSGTVQRPSERVAGSTSFCCSGRMDKGHHRIETRAVHAGMAGVRESGSHVPVIDLSTTNPLADVESGGLSYEE